MRAVEILRNQLVRLNWYTGMPIAKRREITNQLKQARKRGQNPQTLVARLFSEFSAEKLDSAANVN